MPATYTPNLNLALPQVDVDAGWGTTLNSDFVTIDDIFADNGTGTSVGLSVGSGKTLVMGGTLILGRNDGTNNAVAPTEIRGVKKTGTNVAGPNITIDGSNGTGTGGGGYLIFRTAPPRGAGNLECNMANTLVLGDRNNVGVGTDNLGEKKLIVDNDRSINDYNTIFRTNNNGTFENDTLIDFNGSVAFFGNYQSFPLAFKTANTERMRISADGALGFAGANFGSSGQILTSNGSGSTPSWQDNQALTADSSQSVGGVTNVIFDNISSAAESIQIVFHKVKRGSANNIFIRLGISSGMESSGYSSYCGISNSTTLEANEDTAFVIYNTSTTSELTGIITISRMYGDLWDCSFTLANTDTTSSTSGYVVFGGGSKTLAGNLTQIQVIRQGSGNFTSGNVRMMYLK